jgi:hypothetical protein
MGNPLRDALPPAYRKTLYALVMVAGLGFSAWQAADGNWEAFVAGLITSLTTALATANTAGSLPIPKPPKG